MTIAKYDPVLISFYQMCFIVGCTFFTHKLTFIGPRVSGFHKGLLFLSEGAFTSLFMELEQNLGSRVLEMFGQGESLVSLQLFLKGWALLEGRKTLKARCSGWKWGEISRASSRLVRTVPLCWGFSWHSTRHPCTGSTMLDKTHFTAHGSGH